MKKIIIAGAFILSAAAIRATAGSDNTKASCDKAYLSSNGYITDTVPSDTTKKDTTQLVQLALNYNAKDTVPADTTKKDTMFTSAYNHVAYNMPDTVPSDTTKKDTAAFALAILK